MDDKLRVFVEGGSDCPFITTDSEVVANIVSLDSCLGWMEWLYPHIRAVYLNELEDIKKLVANVGFSLEVIEIPINLGDYSTILSTFSNKVKTIIDQDKWVKLDI